MSRARHWLLSDYALELVVGFWLQDLTYGKRTANRVLPEHINLAAAAEYGRIVPSDHRSIGG
jgi:hypothetical protein